MNRTTFTLRDSGPHGSYAQPHLIRGLLTEGTTTQLDLYLGMSRQGREKWGLIKNIIIRPEGIPRGPEVIICLRSGKQYGTTYLDAIRCRVHPKGGHENHQLPATQSPAVSTEKRL